MTACLCHSMRSYKRRVVLKQVRLQQGEYDESGDLECFTSSRYARLVYNREREQHRTSGTIVKRTIFVLQNVIQPDLLTSCMLCTRSPHNCTAYRVLISARSVSKMNGTQNTHYFICFAISLWIALQKSSTEHLPRRRTTGEL